MFPVAPTRPHSSSAHPSGSTNMYKEKCENLPCRIWGSRKRGGGGGGLREFACFARENAHVVHKALDELWIAVGRAAEGLAALVEEDARRELDLELVFFFYAIGLLAEKQEVSGFSSGQR